MHRELFTVPVLIATTVLVVHSWLFRGPRNTLLFWLAGCLMAFGREVAYQNIFSVYRFTGVALKILNVPVTVPMGWLFEAYTSLYLAQFIMGADARSMAAGEAHISPDGYGKRVLPVIAFSCVVTSTITFVIENVSTRMHWWQSEAGGEGINPGWLIGHMFTVFWLLTLLIYLTHKPLRLRRNILYVILAVGFTAVAESGGPTARTYPWGFAVLAAYVASLFLWRQLVIFFLVVVVLNTILLVGLPPTLWQSLSELTNVERTVLQSTSTLAVMLLYGAYLLRTQRPERPTFPAQLL